MNFVTYTNLWKIWSKLNTKILSTLTSKIGKYLKTKWHFFISKKKNLEEDIKCFTFTARNIVYWKINFPLLINLSFSPFKPPELQKYFKIKIRSSHSRVLARQTNSNFYIYLYTYIGRNTYLYSNISFYSVILTKYFE